MEADLISKEIDLDDWSVSDDFFNFINNLWGPLRGSFCEQYQLQIAQI